jgi:hypothetical protein
VCNVLRDCQAGKPLQIVVVRQVQVVIDFRGTHKHFVVSENISEKDFRKAVRIFLSLAPKTKISVKLLGFDDWQVKPGHTYAVAEARKMKVTLHETTFKSRPLEIPGHTDLHDTCEAYRRVAGLPPWIDISIARCDGTPFWIEDKGDYTVETRYNPDLDTRFKCNIRVDVEKEGRSYFLENYRCTEDDPAVIWHDLVSKYGFANTPVTHLSVHGSPKAGVVRFQFKNPTSLDKVTLPAFIERLFTVSLSEDEPAWESQKLISPEILGIEEVWTRLSQEHPLPHWSQFILTDHEDREIPQLSTRLPPGMIYAN